MGPLTYRYGSLVPKTFKLFIEVLLSQVQSCTNPPKQDIPQNQNPIKKQTTAAPPPSLPPVYRCPCPGWQLSEGSQACGPGPETKSLPASLKKTLSCLHQSVCSHSQPLLLSPPQQGLDVLFMGQSLQEGAKSDTSCFLLIMSLRQREATEVDEKRLQSNLDGIN